MADLFDEAQQEMDLQAGWGLSRRDLALMKLLPGVKALVARVNALEARVRALEGRAP